MSGLIQQDKMIMKSEEEIKEAIEAAEQMKEELVYSESEAKRYQCCYLKR